MIIVSISKMFLPCYCELWLHGICYHNMSLSVNHKSKLLCEIAQRMPHNSPVTLVLWCQTCWWNLNGITPNEGTKCRWGWWKLATFGKWLGMSHKWYKIDAVSIKVEYEVVCTLNGDIADDLEWPQTTLFFCILHSRSCLCIGWI